MHTPFRIAIAVFPIVTALPTVFAGAVDDLSMPAHPPELLNDDRRLGWGAVPIFFPPVPPSLESVARGLERRQWETYGRLQAPPELAAFVGEPFYPALSTLLAMQDLGSWSRRRIEEFRATKQKLQAELRAELLRTRDLPSAARLARLAAFAREQTPKIVALEATAERLRTSFTKVDYRWGALRGLYLGHDSRHPEPAEEVADVMRAAAYYEGGLLPDQRLFLREIALELPLAGHSKEESLAAQPDVFFSPGLARVRWPDDLPPSVRRKLAQYQARRSALKKKVYDVVFRADRTFFSAVRSVQLQLSLGPQADTLDQLEDLAEEIRLELAQSPRAPRLRVSPSAITGRLQALFENQRSLCTGTAEMLEAIRRREPALHITYAFEATGLQFGVQPRDRRFFGKNPEAVEQAKAVSAEIATIANNHRRALAELESERIAIVAALTQALHLEDPREIETALMAATREACELESDGPFRAYHTAVFEPGLSPAQRRLLFDSAIQQLVLPLPSGEYQPQ